MVFQDLVCEVDGTNYSEFLKKDFSVMHFFSDLHMNCLTFLPVFEDLAREFFEAGKKVYFGKINIEEFEGPAREHKIINLPTILIFRNGKQVARVESFQEDLLRAQISSLIG